MKLGTIYYDIEQGTPEWDEVKCGKLSASKISDILSNGKGGKESTGRRNLRAKIIGERLSGQVIDSGFQTKEMELGIIREADARNLYSFQHDAEVVQVGFIDHPFLEKCGCSPDGLVGDDGMVEIKSVIPATQIDYITSREIPKKYTNQMDMQMACSGRKWVDFVSYCPELGQKHQLLVIRYERDEEKIKELERAIILFLREVDELLKELEAA